MSSCLLLIHFFSFLLQMRYTFILFLLDRVLCRFGHGVQFVNNWLSVNVGRPGLLWSLAGRPLRSFVVHMLGEANRAVQ